jgi:rod shape-determining protein MreD
MATLLAFPVLAALVMLQSAIASRITLLQGSADLVLVMIIAWALQPRVDTAWQWALIGGLLVHIPSALPPGSALAGYLLATTLALLLRRRVWQAPVLAMLVATLVGTTLSQAIAWLALVLVGIPLPGLASFYQIILPSTLINLILAIPFFSFAGVIADRLYPEELPV